MSLHMMCTSEKRAILLLGTVEKLAVTSSEFVWLK